MDYSYALGKEKKILEETKERIEKLNMADNMCRENAERNRNFEGMKYFQSLMFATERAGRNMAGRSNK